MKVTSSSLITLAATLASASSVSAGVIAPRQASSGAPSATGASATPVGPETASASSTVDSAASASASSGSSDMSMSSATSSPSISASAPAMASPSALPSYSSQNLSSYANSSVHGPQGLRNSNCRNLTISVSTNSSNIQYIDVDDQYSNQSYITAQILQFTNFQMPWIAAHENGTFVSQQDYNVSATYCTPMSMNSTSSSNSTDSANSTLIVASHGIGFNKEYWNFLNDTAPEYSFINQATSDGYSVLTYDRLGTGQTSHPDSGFNQTQIATEVSLLANLIGQLRNGTAFEGQQNYTKIAGVGHSFGSLQMQALTATAPDLLDAVALTGFSNSSAGIMQFLTGATLTPANQVFSNVSRFSNESSVYLVSGSPTSTYELFLWPPNYDPEYAAIAAGPEYADAVTLGQLTSQSALMMSADFKGPVFVISGEHDLPFCAGNCQPPLLDGVQMLYPMAGNFSTFIEPASGHGLVVGYTGPDSNRRVVDFFKGNGL